VSVAWTTATLGRTDAVGSECRHPSYYCYSTFRPHNAGALSATLANGTPSSSTSTSRLRRSFIDVQYLWPTTAVLLPMLVSDDYVPWAERALWVMQTYSTFGDRAIKAADWTMDSLPSNLKEMDLSYNRFWLSPKTFLLDIGDMWTILIVPFRHNLLLTYDSYDSYAFLLCY